MIPLIQLLPCTYKKLFGISCPTCGSQRALVLLFGGQWWEAIKQFPPLPLLVVTLLWLVVALASRRKVLTKPFAILLWTDLAMLIFNCVYQNIFY
ncbi:MAG: DUF2752 domain-containing protein [Bacteroidales bacterium]|nr:DUF2752 domain-containing protein [Bacteroidales bacterium]